VPNSDTHRGYGGSAALAGLHRFLSRLVVQIERKRVTETALVSKHRSFRLTHVLSACLAAVLAGSLPTAASGAGPGGWDHLGDAGSPGTQSLNADVHALNADAPGVLYVGGAFTNAGGNAHADRIAGWNGSSWSAVSSATSQISNGAVFAIAYANGKVYAGGMFQNAGGEPDADYLAVWDGVSWSLSATRPDPRSPGPSTPCRSSAQPCTRAGRSRTPRPLTLLTTYLGATWPPATRARRSTIRRSRLPARCLR
jgi:hypothetical protein